MRNYIVALLLMTICIIIIVPVLMIRGCTLSPKESRRYNGSAIKVFNEVENRVQKMDMEEYIKGVVAAEMPATFEVEALKAQAILARTYVIRRISLGVKLPEHPDAVISTNSNSGQGWLGKEELVKKWGMLNYPFYWNKISQAVEATSGQVLSYQGKLAETLYHSNAGGQTEDAANVWGNAVPYLKSVPSSYDEEAPNFRREFEFNWIELDQKLETDLVQLIHEREGKVSILGPTGLVEILEMSSGGRILQIRVDGKVFIGKEFRTQLGLPTTRCELVPVSTGLKIITYGNGHGVGLSQYGANGMAKRGSNYYDILHHYFPGTLVGQLK